MDSLFQSFNQQVSMHNFAELSGCVFSWIEEQCKPGDLQVGSNNQTHLIIANKPNEPNVPDNFFLLGPGLLNTATDGKQRREK